MKKRTSSSKETYYMTGGQKSVVEKGRRVVKPYAPHENYLPPDHVPLSRRYIHGENFMIPQDELNALMDACVARALRARAKTLCQHPAWTVWQVYDGTHEQRQCLTCNKVEYR